MSLRRGKRPGHTVALTNDNGQVSQSTLYEAFGQVVAQETVGLSTGGLSLTPSLNNRLANTKERDAST